MISDEKMTEQKDLSNNPFAALLTGGDVPYSFQSSKEEQETPESQPVIAVEMKAEDWKSVAEYKLEINNLIETIFLLTLEKDPEAYTERPSRCVFMTDLAQTLEGQTWLDMDCLEQAVFERLLMREPGLYIVSLTSAKTEDAESARIAGESQVLHYLYQCYVRVKNMESQNKMPKMKAEMNKCKAVIVMNAKTCLQQPDLYEQNLSKQFVDIYQSEDSFLSSYSHVIMVEFFDRVVEEIDKSKEDGSLNDVFKPVLESLKNNMMKDSTLMNPNVLKNIDFMVFFTRHPEMAKVLLDHSAPRDWNKGKTYEQTLLGSLFCFSSIPRSELGPCEFFSDPASKSQRDIDAMENNIHQPLTRIGDKVHTFFLSLIKSSSQAKHGTLLWIGRCISANSGKSKIWSAQMPQLFNQMYAYDGFCLNLCYLMLKLSVPFSEPQCDKLLKVQPTYCSVDINNDNDKSQQKNIHAFGLNKETCLIPLAENEQLEPLESYNFISECFFLTHQCLNMGFKPLNEKFVKLNQSLGRIQRLYQDATNQGGNDSMEPVRQLKSKMEEGMTIYLSIRAAVTEPKFLEMSLNFHISTATWMCLVAVKDNPQCFSDITLPLPDEAPKCLSCIPEFIMGNITDFTQFLHRFKDQVFEFVGEKLSHFMTLILVYMGNPDRMKNPHLRAELAETLAMLLPSDQTQNRALMSRYYKGQLFVQHPLIDHLAEKLLHVFVSIEMTGQSVQFEQKFNYRRPMYQVLEHIWEIESHRNAIKSLSRFAEENIEATDAPLFLRFINLLINDAIFLLDEALDYMSQIKDKEQAKEQGEWTNMTPEQRQEAEMSLRQLSMIARYHNVMGNHTIHMLELLTREIKTIFCHNSMVDRISGMLNYFLVNLVGPKQRNFKVKDKDEYEFKPQETVSDISQIYLNLEEDVNFCIAVVNDGRSYSDDLFPKAINVLKKIHKPASMLENMENLHLKNQKLRVQQKADEELFADPPEEFLDEIMGTLMKDPVILPSSGNIVDRSTIARHLLSDQNDPFNREALSLDMVIPHAELQEKIEAWKEEHRNKS
ncbi:ubiquitin conjugation factor E4 A-like isoform X2 [Mytilus galloprovincialis]|uniref:ubiquitin conjugation factor E4 A-like isoform X2 n=1 Tax=Mytilus galloprovincialis TaxID=29158 RepID=UPI003F7B44D1